MPQCAFRLFKLFEDKTMDFSFTRCTDNENIAFVSIARSILQKLGEVILDKYQFGYVEEDEDSEMLSSSTDTKIKFEWLGIGTSKTWHGYPDARLIITYGYSVYA